MAEIHETILALGRIFDVAEACQVLASRLAAPSGVLARVWLLDGDGQLRLAGSAGAPAGGGTYNRLDESFARITCGAGKIGEIAAARTPRIVRGIRGDEHWLVNPGWIARQGVRAFVGYRLVAEDTVVGVRAVFDRAVPSDAALDELRFLADYFALRVVDLQERARLRAALDAAERAVPLSGDDAGAIVTRAELRAIERRTIEAALAKTGGRVFGPRGAAVMLEMKPTTLASRIKALGIP